MTRYFIFTFLICSQMLWGVSAKAQDIPFPLAYSNETMISDNGKTYPLYELTPDKIQILELSEPAASTIIGNEQHLNIYFDTSDRAALVPLRPGASYFEILNSKGKIIASGHALVASPKQDYIRIRRSCPAGNDGCSRMSMYFCPGLCHDVILPSSQSNP